MLTKLKFRAKLSRDKREKPQIFPLRKNRSESDVRPFSSSVSKRRFGGSTTSRFFKEINHERRMRRADIKNATLLVSRNFTDRSLQRYDNVQSWARIKRRAARPDLTRVKPVRGSEYKVEAEVKRREKYADTSKYDFSDYGLEVSYDEMDMTKPEEGEVPPSMGDTLSDIDGSYLSDDPGDLFSPGSKAVNEADDAASQELKRVAEVEAVGEMEDVGDVNDKNNKNLGVALMKPLGHDGELTNFKRPIGPHNDMDMAMRSVDKNLGLSGADELTGQPIGDNSDIDTEIGDIVNESEGGATRDEADEGLKVFDQILRDNMDDYSDLKIPGDVNLDKKAVGQQLMAMENARIKGIDAEMMRQRLNIMEETVAERLRERLEHEKELKEIDNIDELQREISESLEEMSTMMNIKNKSKNATTRKVSTQIPHTYNQSKLGLNTTSSSSRQNETTWNEEHQDMSSTDSPEHGDAVINYSVGYNNIKGNQLTTNSPKKVSKPTTSPKPVERGGTSKGVAIGQKEGTQWRTRESYYDRKRDRTTEGEASDRREGELWRTGKSYNERKNRKKFLDEDEIESPPRANWNYENKLYSKYIKSDTPEQYREESLIVEEHKPVVQGENEKRVSNATARKQHSTKQHRSRKRRNVGAQKEMSDARVADINELSSEPGSSYGMGEGMSEFSSMQSYDPEHDVIWADNDDDDLQLENSQIWLEETDRKAAEEEKSRKNSSQNEMLEKNVFPFADPLAVGNFKEELETGDPLESGDHFRQDGTKTKQFNIEEKDVSDEQALENKNNQIKFQPPTIEKPLTDEQLLAEFQLTKNSKLPTNNQSPQRYQLLTDKQLLTNKQLISNDHLLTNAQPGDEELSKQNIDANNSNPLSMYSKFLGAIGMTSTNNQTMLASEKSQSNIVIKDVPVAAIQDVVTAKNSVSMNVKQLATTNLAEAESKRNDSNGTMVMDPSFIKDQIKKVKFEPSNIAEYHDRNPTLFDVEAQSPLAVSKSNQPLATAELNASEVETLEDFIKGLRESKRPIAKSKKEALEKVLGKSRNSQLPAIPQSNADEIPTKAQNIQSAFTGQIDEQKSYENSNRLFSSLLELEEKIKNPQRSETAEADILRDTDGVMQLEPFEYLPVKSGTRDGGETVEDKKGDELGDVTDKDETSEFYKKWNQIENMELRRLESNVVRQRYEALDDLRKENLRMKLSQDEDVENEEGNDGLTAAISDLDDEKLEKSFQDLSLLAEIPVHKKGSGHLLGKKGKPKGSNTEKGKENNGKKSSHR
ncbi:unnamed protein product [Lymnaea stagnalis]|uniref:Uncharacterized protein n=1 Tax=Lymnaea stagnalis TaxID=6523 RepID=A0AAV2IKL2_LYMST